jgi:hypothetical protein
MGWSAMRARLHRDESLRLNEEITMLREQIVRATAGTLILASLVLGYLYTPHLYWLTTFVGLNLLQSAFTRWCLLEQILGRLGVARYCEPVIDQIRHTTPSTMRRK